MSDLVFHQEVFDVFEIEGLDQRMPAIQKRVQPVFRKYGHHLAEFIKEELDLDQAPPVHVAKHLQRKKHAPENTWVAIGGDKRGYKRYPHFEIGINSDYVLVTLALLDKVDRKAEIASYLAEHSQDLRTLPEDFVMIPDHMALDYFPLKEVDVDQMTDRLQKVKKAECMLGRVAKSGNQVLEDETLLGQWLITTVKPLLKTYQALIEED